MLNNFKLEFKIKTRVFKNWCGFIIKGLTKALYKAIYLRQI
jgi:hypothetical protein